MKFGVRELLFMVLLLAIPAAAYLWVFKPVSEHVETQRQAIETKEKKRTLLSLSDELLGAAQHTCSTHGASTNHVQEFSNNGLGIGFVTFGRETSS